MRPPIFQGVIGSPQPLVFYKSPISHHGNPISRLSWVRLIPSQSRLCGPLLRSIVSQGTCSAACGAGLSRSGALGPRVQVCTPSGTAPARPRRPFRPATGGAGSIPTATRSRHLGRLSPPLRSVSCPLFVLMRWRCCPGGGAMGTRAGGGLGNKVPLGGLENKERKMPKTKGRLGDHGAGPCTHKRELGQRRGADVRFRG